MLSENSLVLVHTTDTTESTTFDAFSVEVPSSASCAVALAASATGGDGTTSIRIYLETSTDGVNWFTALSTTISSAAGAVANQLVYLARYVRTRIAISGTAPDAVLWDAVLLFGGPMTATAV